MMKFIILDKKTKEDVTNEIEGRIYFISPYGDLYYYENGILYHADMSKFEIEYV